MRRSRAGLMAVVMAVGVVGSAAAARPVPASAAAPIFVETFKPAPGPHGAVTILGDSVMLGSAYELPGYGPSLAQRLAAQGWGPILTKTGVGFQAGLNVGGNPGANMSLYVKNQRAAGWDSPVYIVNVGGNDILGCSSNQACAVKDILGLVDTIGPDHEIWWSKITMTKQSDADAWNGALDIVAAQRSNVRLWEWPSIRAANGIPIAGDNIHLPNGAAYNMRSALIADDITARFGVSSHVGGPESVPTAAGAPSTFQPLTLERVYDSRDLPERVAANGVVQLDLSSKVPAGATAVSINLTAVRPSAPGFLTAYPCGAAPPPTSNVNFLAGQIRPNHVVVGLGPGSRLCVLSSAVSDVIVDLQGAFVATGGLKLTPLSPSRVADTRDTGRVDPLVVRAPDGAAGVVVNVTGVGAVADGFLVVYPCGATVPGTSNLNFVRDAPVAGSAYVPVGAAGTVCVHASQPIDVVVDLHGIFAADGALRFQPAVPKRMLDTRLGIGGWRGQIGPGQQIDIGVAPPGASAVTGNITMIQPGIDGFQTAFACSLAVPPTSSVNADRGLIAANSLTVSSTSSVCVRSSVGAHLIVDTTGWWLP
jgi:hypothetical protein